MGLTTVLLRTEVKRLDISGSAHDTNVVVKGSCVRLCMTSDL